MTGDVENVVLEILKRIQTDIADLRASVDTRLDAVDGRLGAVDDRLITVEGRLSLVEDSLRRQRRDVAGLLVIAKSAAGDLALQIEAVERRTAALEAAGQ
jgi:hypothetical protein